MSVKGGSRVACLLHNTPQDHRIRADCHGRPPFWEWWRDYRNCIVTNACLFRQTLTLYDDSANGSLRVGSPLACNNWNGPSYNVEVVAGTPPEESDSSSRSQRDDLQPAETIWLDLALMASRVLPGHFGHDILNNGLYLFNTFWEFGLSSWLEPPATLSPRRAVLLVEDDSITTLADAFVTVINYNMNPQRYSMRPT